VHFLSRGPDYTVLFRDHEADFILAKRKYASDTDSQSGARTAHQRTDAASIVDVLRMHLIGASTGSGLSGQDRLPGIVNYFSGSDAALWHTGIPTFAKMQYCGVYPGIDLVYHGNPSRLEFDFQVAPGASASRIRLHFAGARRLELDGNGNLIVFARHGRIEFHKPLIYQLESDNSQRIVEGRFRVFTNGTLGFGSETTIIHGDWSSIRFLIIQPIWEL